MLLLVASNLLIVLVLTTCELSVVWYLQFDKSVYKNFEIPIFDDNLIKIMAKDVIQASYDIYTHRDVENVKLPT